MNKPNNKAKKVRDFAIKHAKIDPQRVYNLQETADILRVKTRMIYYYAKQKKLLVIKRKRFNHEILGEWIIEFLENQARG